MVLNALGDPSGGSDLSLKDGRPLHMVKLVCAVRSSEERSTNVFIDVEDGTGLTQVKVWVNEGDECSAIAQLRNAAGREHTYIRVIGQIRDFDGQRQIVANDIRPVSTGNEITHHLLEVAHSYEKYRKLQSESSSIMGGMGMGIGIGNMASMAPLQGGGGGMGMGGQGYAAGGGGGGGVDEAVVQVIKTLGCE
jgi:replication factor A2